MFCCRVKLKYRGRRNWWNDDRSCRLLLWFRKGVCPQNRLDWNIVECPGYACKYSRYKIRFQDQNYSIFESKLCRKCTRLCVGRTLRPRSRVHRFWRSIYDNYLIKWFFILLSLLLWTFSKNIVFYFLFCTHKIISNTLNKYCINEIKQFDLKTYLYVATFTRRT